MTCWPASTHMKRKRWTRTHEKVYASEDGPDPDACFDLGIMLLAHTVMSEAQWEKFYWPSLKHLLDAAAAKRSPSV